MSFPTYTLDDVFTYTIYGVLKGKEYLLERRTGNYWIYRQIMQDNLAGAPNGGQEATEIKLGYRLPTAYTNIVVDVELGNKANNLFSKWGSADISGFNLPMTGNPIADYSKQAEPSFGLLFSFMEGFINHENWYDIKRLEIKEDGSEIRLMRIKIDYWDQMTWLKGLMEIPVVSLGFKLLSVESVVDSTPGQEPVGEYERAPGFVIVTYLVPFNRVIVY